MASRIIIGSFVMQWVLTRPGIRGRQRDKIHRRGSHPLERGSNLYLSVHSLPQEDHYDTDDASAGEVYSILVSESTVCTIQPPRRRQHRTSIVDRHTQTHRTAALHSL